MRFLLTIVLLTLASVAQAAAPQCPLPPQAPAVRECDCGPDCRCTPARSCGCPALPAPPAAPPPRICDADGCRIATASTNFPAIATTAQVAEFRGERRKPIRNLFAAIVGRVAARRGCN